MPSEGNQALLETLRLLGYLRDIAHKYTDISALGPLVVAQGVVQPCFPDTEDLLMPTHWRGLQGSHAQSPPLAVVAQTY